MKKNLKEPSSVIMPTALGAAGPAQQVWDGRLLDGDHQGESVGRKLSDAAQPSMKRVSGMTSSDHAVASVKGTKYTGQALSGHAASKAQDQCPMTPPRVAGVSMAPVAGNVSDFSFPDLASQKAQPQQPQRQAGGAETSGKGALNLKRPVALKVTVPGNSGQPNSELISLQVVGRLNVGQGGAEGGPSAVPAAAATQPPIPPQPHAPKFMAEGRAVTLTRYTQGPPPGEEDEEAAEVCSDMLAPPQSPLNHNLIYYREINETDSLCGTPPSISIATLNREFDERQPLGPLSPNPLSPSILTLCGPLGEMELRKGASREFSGEVPEGAITGISAEKRDRFWSDSFEELPDMRDPGSPFLEKCDSPAIP
ncbi:hypothetical protein CEUSTIGMA_g1178.t1 [Chlamydomonas eustigma]|uniref:Uncharacterized protein n=1 Tax=Chlamydomonas eustigma TaxID=1157962 RepID=A0A250WSB4_9CHLO|nr:hypothetical protein CEUSTIGMA_g1178.t1 [Chlamydomonas eustigma]|eukprot:GAX73725.1 hypothetical protein CEUSTIGMA_g1178.t1 [Chlamydomonas eustigma]